MTKKSVKRRRHTPEFRAESVRLVACRGDRTVGDIAQSLGVAESLLHTWKRQAETMALENARGETPEQELVRLRSENADLKRDRDALANQSPMCHEREPASARSPTTFAMRVGPSRSGCTARSQTTLR